MGYVKNVARDNKEVFLGLGPKRFLVAFLSRNGLLIPLLLLVQRLVRPIYQAVRTSLLVIGYRC